MPLRATSYLNNNLKILQGLLEYGKEVKFRKRVIGWGLHESDFDKNEIPGTRKIMRSRIEPFLESRYIKKIIETDKRSKGYYTITPLGLSFLFQNRSIDARNIFKKTIKNLQFFIKFQKKQSNKSENDPILDFQLIEEQIKKIDNQLLFQTLNSIFNQITIKKNYHQTEIDLIHSFDKDTFTITKRFIIKNNKIYEKKIKNIEEITEKELNYYIALFILLSFHHILVRHFIVNENRKMFESFNIEILKEISEFNVSRYNEIFPKLNDYMSIQKSIDNRLKIIL